MLRIWKSSFKIGFTVQWYKNNVAIYQWILEVDINILSLQRTKSILCQSQSNGANMTRPHVVITLWAHAKSEAVILSATLLVGYGDPKPGSRSEQEELTKNDLWGSIMASGYNRAVVLALKCGTAKINKLDFTWFRHSLEMLPCLWLLPIANLPTNMKFF
jgi:hypothetical protein